MTDIIAKRFFIMSIIAFLLTGVFTYGIIVGIYKVWPYSILHEIKEIAKSLINEKRIAPDRLVVRTPEDAPKERIKIYDKDLMQSGFYVFLGWDDELRKFAAWLYDDKGNILHTWPIDYYAMDPDGPINGSDSPHAFYVMEDGTIILNFDKGDILSRIDSCGKPVWIKKGVFHHSLFKSDDGSFWTWRGNGTAYGHYNYINNFDPANGSTIKEISLIDDIIKGESTSSIIFSVRRDYKFAQFEKTPENKVKEDMFHPNDVEILTQELAEKFPMFSAGDILLSFRNINLIAVMEPESYRFKWWSNGPWRLQHDPDFTLYGKISVFNNNSGRGRSEIIKIDPKNRSLSNDLLEGNVKFYTDSMGDHQYLPNGNILIVVPLEGRVIVTTKNGNKILEFNNIIKNLDGKSAHVSNGMWVPLDYFDKLPECIE